MAEDKYTWEDLIFNPTTDEAKNAIGKEVYYSDTPLYCIDYANENNEEFLGVLDRTEKSNNPFHIKESINWACIIVKKKPSYEDRAKQWIRDNNLKVGDYVKVIRRAKDYEDGWDCRWNKGMDDFVGKVIPVSAISEVTGVIISYCCCDWAGYGFPYFVLEKVEEPKSEYVPFESLEEFISAYDNADNAIRSSTELKLSGFGMWLKCGEHYELVTYIHNNGITIDDVSINWKTLFDSYTFLDGSLCGKLVEESNA